METILVNKQWKVKEKNSNHKLTGISFEIVLFNELHSRVGRLAEDPATVSIP